MSREIEHCTLHPAAIGVGQTRVLRHRIGEQVLAGRLESVSIYGANVWRFSLNSCERTGYRDSAIRDALVRVYDSVELVTGGTIREV